jgi:hypothetical protein
MLDYGGSNNLLQWGLWATVEASNQNLPMWGFRDARKIQLPTCMSNLHLEQAATPPSIRRP